MQRPCRRPGGRPGVVTRCLEPDAEGGSWRGNRRSRYARPDGRPAAVSRRPLLRRGRPGGRSRRASLRRRCAATSASGSSREPVQRPPPHAARVRGGGAAPLSRVACERDPRTRGRARVVASRRGLRRPGRRPARPARHRRLARGGAVRDGQRPAARAHASADPRGAAPPARGDARPARADLPAPRRGPRRRAACAIRPSSRSTAPGSGACPTSTSRRSPTSALLIADGHHRYESALDSTRTPRRIMALLVSTHDPGLHVFPTHRVFSRRPDLAELGEASRTRLSRARSPPSPRRRATTPSRSRTGARGSSSCADARASSTWSSSTGTGSTGSSTRRSGTRPTAAVDRGEADVAFLLREPRVDEIFAVARRGERMPPKSTYFFPKPLSGLLFHPVEPEP